MKINTTNKNKSIKKEEIKINIRTSTPSKTTQSGAKEQNFSPSEICVYEEQPFVLNNK
jgi:hypothetical protein